MFFLLLTDLSVSDPGTKNNEFNATLADLPPMHTLYVEDNPDVRELICWMLEDEGLQVVACSNAQDAESEFALRRFDILITDVGLPSMPGTELARRLQKDRPDLWVIFCSGYPMTHGLQAWGSRARSLSKPFDVEELQQLLAECRSTLS